MFVLLDTVKIIHEFPMGTAKEDWLRCYAAVNSLAGKLSGQKLLLLKTSEKVIHYTGCFKGIGILNISFAHHEPCRESGYFVKIVVNPGRMVKPKKKVYLAQEKDYPRFESRFNVCMAFFNGEAGKTLLPELNNWKPARVDYAVDIRDVPAQRYIDLFKKGHLPEKLKIRSKKACYLYKASFYCPFQEYTINFYDKKAQLAEKKGIQLAHELLRLEVQLHLRHKDRIKTALNLPLGDDLTVKALWDKDLAYATLRKVVLAVVGSEDFRTEEANRAKLLAADMRATTREAACAFLELLRPYNRNIDNAKEQLIKRYSGEYSSNCLEKAIFAAFARVGINPIPIPASWNIDTLENPLRFVERYFA
jgi:hypothetical protein